MTPYFPKFLVILINSGRFFPATLCLKPIRWALNISVTVLWAIEIYLFLLHIHTLMSFSNKGNTKEYSILKFNPNVKKLVGDWIAIQN